MAHLPLLSIEERDGLYTVKLAANALDETHLQQVGEELFGVIDRTAGAKLHLDLRAVPYIGSTALGKFVALHKRLRSAGGQLALVNVGGLVDEVLRISRLDRILDVRRRADEPAAPPLAS